jgi:hypothetical protein
MTCVRKVLRSNKLWFSSVPPGKLRDSDFIRTNAFFQILSKLPFTILQFDSAYSKIRYRQINNKFGHCCNETISGISEHHSSKQMNSIINYVTHILWNMLANFHYLRVNWLLNYNAAKMSRMYVRILGMWRGTEFSNICVYFVGFHTF